MEKSEAYIKKFVGARIKEMRISKGLSQKELGEILGKGYSQTLINFYEHGEREIKSITLIKLSNALDVSPNILLGYKESELLLEVSKNQEFINLIKSDPQVQIKKIVKLYKNIEQLYIR